MRKLIVIAAAGGALAIGLPAALAVGDSPETTQAPTTLQPVQTAEPEQPPRDRDDCPEKNGGGGESGADAPTATPEI